MEGLDAIQHPMPLYGQCTLQDILWIGAGSLLLTCITLPLILKLLGASAALGLTLAFPSSGLITRWGIHRVSRWKHDRPVSYTRQRCYQILSQYGLYHAPYLTHRGRWSIGS